jgi:hypothetical protein
MSCGTQRARPAFCSGPEPRPIDPTNSTDRSDPAQSPAQSLISSGPHGDHLDRRRAAPAGARDQLRPAAATDPARRAAQCSISFSAPPTDATDRSNSSDPSLPE